MGNVKRPGDDSPRNSEDQLLFPSMVDYRWWLQQVPPPRSGPTIQVVHLYSRVLLQALGPCLTKGVCLLSLWISDRMARSEGVLRLLSLPGDGNEAFVPKEKRS